MLISENYDEFLKYIKECSKFLKEKVKEGCSFRIVTHHDADGLSSGSIIFKALTREGAKCSIRCIKQLDKDFLKEIKKDNHDIIIFTDLGSGAIEELERIEKNKHILILDHHLPKKASEKLFFANPHLYNIDGAREVSSSGISYLVARFLSEKNIDLVTLAIVGAIGDMQDRNDLSGVNRVILDEGIKNGYVKAERDLKLYGRETRPIFKALEYTTDPFFPELSGDEKACIDFLKMLDIPLKDGEKWRTLADLTKDEKKRLATALMLKLIENGYPAKVAESIVGEVYTFIKEEKGSPLRDSKEFATLLNACGKNGYYSIGIAVCLGDRDKYYRRALRILAEHRAYINSCYKWILENKERIKSLKSIYFLNAGREIKEEIIGTVASMVLSTTLRDKPIVAVAESKENKIKVSARGTKELVEKGLHLGKAMIYASEAVGGEGGGHDIAAGALIDKESLDKFISHVDEIVRRQLNAGD